MKKIIVPGFAALSAMVLLSGCLVIGNRGLQGTGTGTGTIGQQLIDLQTAKANAAITDAEYQTLKAKILGDK